MKLTTTTLSHEIIETLISQEIGYFKMLAELRTLNSADLLHCSSLPEYRDVNRALRFRTNSKHFDEEFDQILKWFQNQGLKAVFDLDPIAISLGIGDFLIQRGLSADFDDRSLMRLPSDWRPQCIRSSVEIRALSREAFLTDVELWIETAISDDLGSKWESLWRTVSTHETRHPGVTLYLATLGSQPAGCCSLFTHEGWGRVESVITKKGFRRKGVAHSLVQQACLDSIRFGNTTTFLYTASNSPAEQLYRKIGFEMWAKNFFQRVVT